MVDGGLKYRKSEGKRTTTNVWIGTQTHRLLGWDYEIKKIKKYKKTDWISEKAAVTEHKGHKRFTALQTNKFNSKFRGEARGGRGGGLDPPSKKPYPPILCLN